MSYYSDEETYGRITKIWTEALLLQKSLQEIDSKITKYEEKVREEENISKNISVDNARLFERVGRLYIETSPENYREKYKVNLIEKIQLERSRELLLMNYQRLESLLRQECEEEPLYCLQRALCRLGELLSHHHWMVFNVPTGE